MSTTTTVRDLSTHEKVIEFLEEVLEHFDYAGTYGEPGYSLDEDKLTPMVVLSDYWCRCHNYADERTPDRPLHGIEVHYPQEFELLEEQGVELQWHDEWTVVYDEDAAYRTQSDSYHWMPSAIYSEEYEWMTPKTPDEVWVEWALNDPARCIPSGMLEAHDPTLVGWDDQADEPQQWFEWSEDYYDHGLPTTYYNGWHSHMTATPEAVTEQIRRAHPGADVVFVLSETSQFYIGFQAYYRLAGEEAECD